jgi:hypothetical protein
MAGTFTVDWPSYRPLACFRILDYRGWANLSTSCAPGPAAAATREVRYSVRDFRVPVIARL